MVRYLVAGCEQHNVTVSKANLERLCKGTFLILLLGNHEDKLSLDI